MTSSLNAAPPLLTDEEIDAVLTLCECTYYTHLRAMSLHEEGRAGFDDKFVADCENAYKAAREKARAVLARVAAAPEARELAIALRDLLQEVHKIADICLPDGFDARAVRNAEIALAAFPAASPRHTAGAAEPPFAYATYSIGGTWKFSQERIDGTSRPMYLHPPHQQQAAPSGPTPAEIREAAIRECAAAIMSCQHSACLTTMEQVIANIARDGALADARDAVLALLKKLS